MGGGTHPVPAQAGRLGSRGTGSGKEVGIVKEFDRRPALPYHGYKGTKCLAEAGVGADPSVRPWRANPRVRPYKKEEFVDSSGQRGTLAEKGVANQELRNENKK